MFSYESAWHRTGKKKKKKKKRVYCNSKKNKNKKKKKKKKKTIKKWAARLGFSYILISTDCLARIMLQQHRFCIYKGKINVKLPNAFKCLLCNVLYIHGGEPTSHHVILIIGSTCYFWKSCAIRVRLCLIFPLILVRFAWNLKQIPRKNYWNMPI